MKWSVPGLIALDLSLALNLDNRPITSVVESLYFESCPLSKLKQFFDEYHERIRPWVAGHGVLGVMVFDSVVRMRPDREYGLDGISAWLKTARTVQDERLFDAFIDRLCKGIPNLELVTR